MKFIIVLKFLIPQPKNIEKGELKFLGEYQFRENPIKSQRLMN